MAAGATHAHAGKVEEDEVGATLLLLDANPKLARTPISPPEIPGLLMATVNTPGGDRTLKLRACAAEGYLEQVKTAAAQAALILGAQVMVRGAPPEEASAASASAFVKLPHKP